MAKTMPDDIVCFDFKAEVKSKLIQLRGDSQAIKSNLHRIREYEPEKTLRPWRAFSI